MTIVTNNISQKRMNSTASLRYKYYKTNLGTLVWPHIRLYDYVCSAAHRFPSLCCRCINKGVYSPQSHRVTESQSDRVTDTQGYSVYGWVKFFVPDFNKLPYSLRSLGDKNTFWTLVKHSFISSLSLAAVLQFQLLMKLWDSVYTC